MKKVFIIHGYKGSPNGGWRPWLMGELEKLDVYACALPMPSANKPLCSEWIEEISRAVEQNKKDEIYLVGHSLGVPAILHFLAETKAKNIHGGVLVSGPIVSTKKGIESFFKKSFNYKSIRARTKQFVIIHGDTDQNVFIQQGKELAENLDAGLVIVKNGGHLNGSSGWTQLPQCLRELKRMMK